MKKMWVSLVIMSLMTAQLPAAAGAVVAGARRVAAYLPAMRGGALRAGACSITPYGAKDVVSIAGSSSSGGEHLLLAVGGIAAWFACALVATHEEVAERRNIEAFMRANPHMLVCVFDCPDGTKRHVRNPFYQAPSGQLS